MIPILTKEKHNKRSIISEYIEYLIIKTIDLYVFIYYFDKLLNEKRLEWDEEIGET